MSFDISRHEEHSICLVINVKLYKNLISRHWTEYKPKFVRWEYRKTTLLTDYGCEEHGYKSIPVERIAPNEPKSPQPFFPFYILATTHKRQVGSKTCKNTLSSPISKPLELDCSWTRHFITNNTTVWNEHIMLHFKYNLRGRVKLHALNSASIKLKTNPRAVDEKHEGSKCSGTTLISSQWESRLTEPCTY